MSDHDYWIMCSIPWFVASVCGVTREYRVMGFLGLLFTTAMLLSGAPHS
jgi:hypothetical protein